MDLSAIALQGLQQADTQLNAAAIRIASCGASAPDAANLDTVDLSSQVVALMAAKNAFAINLKTLQTANEVSQNLMNVMG